MEAPEINLQQVILRQQVEIGQLRTELHIKNQLIEQLLTAQPTESDEKE